MLDDLLASARNAGPAWLRAASAFLLVGFGTKMGLAPMHTWKPDTYGEAPSLVGGLMAGALTSCAFLGLARVAQVMLAAGLAAFVRPLLVAFGLLSLVVAAFIIGQADLKRLLAYSSVEHMGLLALGLGLGGAGAYGAVLHVVNNGLAERRAVPRSSATWCSPPDTSAAADLRHAAAPADVACAARGRTVCGVPDPPRSGCSSANSRSSRARFAQISCGSPSR